MDFFVYVIYDKCSGEILALFANEDDCVNRYMEQFEGSVNIDWMAINVSYVIKNYFQFG